MLRQFELYKQVKLEHKNIIISEPLLFYPQETDWTCSIACIRTIMSGIQKVVPSEKEFIKEYLLEPQPYYSIDIMNKKILEKYDAIYGCDKKDVNFDYILQLMENGYYVMLESLINYAHWMVLLGYYPLGKVNEEKSKLLFYDPYYDDVRILVVDEFISMWANVNYEKTGIKKDFIAIKK